jgi:hypothetical protein
LTSDNALKNLRAMLKTNQNGGFDCPGCAWGDSPEAAWSSSARTAPRR